MTFDDVCELLDAILNRYRVKAAEVDRLTSQVTDLQRHNTDLVERARKADAARLDMWQQMDAMDKARRRRRRGNG